MALVVSTNINAMDAQRNLSMNGLQLSQAMSRLSSGSRINSAADDAAGLAIATRLGAQIGGIDQATRNANDGIALLQTAEGAMSEITNIVTKIKQLAVQSANSTNSSSDRTSLNSQVSALVSEVTRIATQTQFGTTYLLDGSFSGNFQVGTNAGQMVSASVANFKATALSSNVSTESLSFHGDVTALGAADAAKFLGINSSTGFQMAGPLSTSYIRQTTAADDTMSSVSNATSAIALAKAVNDSQSATGVTATVGATSYTINTVFNDNINVDGSSNVLKINNQSVVVNLNGGSQAANNTLLASAINAQVSGVTAAVSGSTVVLTAADGRNISLATSAGTGNNTTGGEVLGFTTAVTSDTVVARGTVSLSASSSFTTSTSGLGTVTGSGASTNSSVSLASLGVDTVANANTAMTVADAVLNTISTQRGNMGALENRLTSTVSNLSVVSEKVSDAKSRILDADFAAETANLTKANILQQAGIAILAQANQAPQMALKLLQ